MKAKKRVVTNATRPARRTPTVRRIKPAIAPALRPRSMAAPTAVVEATPVARAPEEVGEVDLTVDLGAG